MMLLRILTNIKLQNQITNKQHKIDINGICLTIVHVDSFIALTLIFYYYSLELYWAYLARVKSSADPMLIIKSWNRDSS